MRQCLNQGYIDAGIKGQIKLIKNRDSLQIFALISALLPAG